MATLDSRKRNGLPKRSPASPKAHKETLEDADQVRSAISRFTRVTGVSDAERAAAWKHIVAAAAQFELEIDDEVPPARNGKAVPGAGGKLKSPPRP